MFQIKFLRTIGGRDGEALRNMTRTIFDDAVLSEFTWEGTATKRSLKGSGIISAFLKVLEGSTVHDLKTFYGPYLRNAPVRFRTREFFSFCPQIYVIFKFCFCRNRKEEE